MEQFLIVAAVHFLALLSPGPDFFLVARTSIAKGWRVASGACLGVALANGAFITAAFAGFSFLRPGEPLFVALQLSGSLYLVYLGCLFIRHAGGNAISIQANAAPSRPASFEGKSWARALSMGFLSGILNPKNALFYASLAAMLTASHTGAGWKAVYGLWMFSAVLLWDLLIAAAIGNQRMLQSFSRALPWLERISGAVLIALAIGILATQVWR